MNHQTTIETRDALFGLGFQPDEKVVSDVSPGLSFDFGNFKLSASWVINFRCIEIVLFTGVLAAPRSLSLIKFEMPRWVSSRAECGAWIVWYLDRDSDRSQFQPSREVAWLKEGRENRTLLPWIRRRGAYNSR